MTTETTIDVSTVLLFLEEPAIQCECVDYIGEPFFHAMRFSPVLDWSDPSLVLCENSASWIARLTFRINGIANTSEYFFCDNCILEWQELALSIEKI